MNISIKILSFIFFITICFGLLIIKLKLENRFVNSRSTNSSITPVVSTYATKECADLAKSILKMVNNANYCNLDSDCTSKIAVGYPAGCYSLVNKNSDIQGIESAYLQFANKCHPPLYDCDRGPTQDEIRCIKNICIDTRYNN